VKHEKTYISLFGGIGGFDLPLKQLGWSCLWYCDNDKYAVQIYNKNFGTDYRPTDVRIVDTRTIPDHTLLTAGFPCQSFSIAGKRRGFEDTRGTLFFEIARILRNKRPRYIFLENVQGLLSAQNGEVFTTILGVLTELGYDLQWYLLDSRDFGVPQSRKRLFIIGNLRGEPRPEIFPITEAVGLVEKEDGEQARRGLHRLEVCEALDSSYWKGADGKRTMIIDTKKQGVPRLYMNQAPTLQSNDWKEPLKVIDRGSVRRLTPIECECLQGFPNGWTGGVSDTQRYKMLGNAVTTNVVRAIMERFDSSMKTREQK